MMLAYGNVRGHFAWYKAKKDGVSSLILHLSVSEMRFELTQPFGHYPLKVACLPISPPGHEVFLSEKRDSNPRPQPWQGCALPTELFSRA